MKSRPCTPTCSPAPSASACPGRAKRESIPGKNIRGALVKRSAAAGLAPVLASFALVSSAWAAPREGEAQFRALYQELVETNTSLSVGDCTLAAQRMEIGRA